MVRNRSLFIFNFRLISMNRFIYKILFFFFLFSFTSLGILWILCEISFRTINDFKIQKETENIIVGDSHPQLAINDKEQNTTQNFAESGEPLIYTYFKLQTLLNKSENSVQTIYLNVGYHSISSSNNEYIYGYGEASKEFPSKYFPLMSYNWKYNLLMENFRKAPGLISNIIFYNTKYLLLNQYPVIGGFKNNFKNVSSSTNSIRRRINNQFYLKKIEQDFSEINIKALVKIQKLAKYHNKKLIILTTPTHKFYDSLVPKKFKKKFSDMVIENKLEILGISKLVMEDDCFLPDGDHLSLKGANIYSKHFYETILD